MTASKEASGTGVGKLGKLRAGQNHVADLFFGAGAERHPIKPDKKIGTSRAKKNRTAAEFGR
ncbi:MAG: hypothetical protein AAF449_12620 [Myxococcota bacterium]